MKQYCYMTTEYSKKEVALFKEFGFDETFIQNPSLTPTMLYRMCVENAFISNIQNEASNSLRKCIIALNTSSIYRLTPEWDSLINV